MKCANPVSLPCVWDPSRCVTHMTDYTDPESPVADPHAVERLTYVSRSITGNDTCEHCHLLPELHINGYFCPEWRLRQLDGDR